MKYKASKYLSQWDKLFLIYSWVLTVPSESIGAANSFVFAVYKHLLICFRSRDVWATKSFTSAQVLEHLTDRRSLLPQVCPVRLILKRYLTLNDYFRFYSSFTAFAVLKERMNHNRGEKQTMFDQRKDGKIYSVKNLLRKNKVCSVKVKDV